MQSPMPKRGAALIGAGLAVAAAAAGIVWIQLNAAVTPDPATTPSVTSSAPPAAVPSASASALDAAPEAAPRPFVLVAGGDVNFGRECGQAILTNPKYDPFRFVEPLWRDADVRFVNLESQLSDQNGETQSPHNRLIFTGPPGGADVLAQAGVHVVSTANNHAWDYGRSALFETLENLARAGVANAGSGKRIELAYEPAVVRARGKSVAVFAVTHIWNQGRIEKHEGRHYVAWVRLERLRRGLERASREHDLVILSYHGGAEYIDAPVGPTRRFLEAVMKTGFVDAVIGHHPHVPQGVGWYEKEKPIFYSLGNFVFAGHDWAPRTKFGFLARLELGGDGRLVTFACPYVLDGHVPKPVGPDHPDNPRIRADLDSTSTSVGGSRVGEPDERGCWELGPS